MLRNPPTWPSGEPEVPREDFMAMIDKLSPARRAFVADRMRALLLQENAR